MPGQSRSPAVEPRLSDARSLSAPFPPPPGSWFMVYDLWCLVYGSCLMVHDSWFMVYGLWFMAYGLWLMVFGVCFIIYGLWFMDFVH